ncbi:hypothetical protein Tco_0980451, partial [Tanacetum coccineum]
MVAIPTMNQTCYQDKIDGEHLKDGDGNNPVPAESRARVIRNSKIFPRVFFDPNESMDMR